MQTAPSAVAGQAQAEHFIPSRLMLVSPGISMNTPFSIKASLIVAALLAVSAVNAQAMPKADYKAAKTRIGIEYTADKKACADLKANAKDICREEAKAKDKVALAELEFNYSGKPADGTKLAKAKVSSAYAVAKEKCDDQAGNAKDVCNKEAKAVEVKGMANITMGKEIGEAKKDAAQDKRDADYKVAVEKCDALAGDAKSTCIQTAKTHFGKT
jgi:hypothetical protein